MVNFRLLGLYLDWFVYQNYYKNDLLNPRPKKGVDI